MSRKLYLLSCLLLSLTLTWPVTAQRRRVRVPVSPMATNTAADARVRQLADEYLRGYYEFNPTRATALGLHEYDAQLEARSSDAIARETRRVRVWLAQAARIPARSPTYTDGRMAPHEWLRGTAGTVFKTDNSGHVQDHTLIGAQPLLWDIAGVLIEWDLTSADALSLLRPLEQAGVPLERETSPLYLRRVCCRRRPGKGMQRLRGPWRVVIGRTKASLLRRVT